MKTRVRTITLLVAAVAALLCGTVQAELIANYEYEGDNNDTAAAGNNYHGSVVNSPTYGTGIIGQAVNINYRAAMRTPSSMSTSPAESVSLWVYETSQGDEVGYFNDTWTGNEDGWALGHRKDGSHPVGTQRFIIDSRRGEIWPSGVQISTNEWHHFVATYDKSVGNGQMKLYLDGVLSGTANPGSSDSDNLDFSNQWVGGLDNGNSDYGHVNGQIDDLGLYSRALSLTEVKSLNSLARSSLNYGAGQFEDLLEVYDTGLEDMIDGMTWSQAFDLSGGEGIVQDLGGGSFALQLDANGGGVITSSAVVPEPASIAIWSLLGLCLAGYGYLRRRRNR